MFVRGYDKDDVFRRPRVVHFVGSLGEVIPILVRLFVKGVLDLLLARELGGGGPLMVKLRSKPHICRERIGGQSIASETILSSWTI